MPGKYGAGQGGWPTVRYFNAETGVDGAPYEKKTSKSMCDELGDMEYMRAYINDKGVPSCVVGAEPSSCTAKEQEFLASWSGKDAPAVDRELARLGKLLSSKGKPDQVKWIRQRHSILKQLAAKAPGTAEL